MESRHNLTAMARMATKKKPRDFIAGDADYNVVNDIVATDEASIKFDARIIA